MSWAQFRRFISQHFDVEELRTLCFDLNVDYDALRGEGKEARVRELVALFRRNGRLPDLIEALTNIRPNVPWQAAASGDFPGPITGRLPAARHALYALVIIGILAAGGFLALKLLQPGPDQSLPAPGDANTKSETYQISLTVFPTAPADVIPIQDFIPGTVTAVSGKIVFSRYPINNPNQVEICVWTAAANRVDCLKLAGRFPVWSPDGAQILFIHQGTDGQSKIYLASADGTNLQELSIPNTDKNPREPDWSPDGSSLVFIAGEAEGTNIYTLDLQENQIGQITTNPNIDFNPNWSAAVFPAKILFISWFGDPPRQGIYLIDPASPIPEETRQLLFNTTSIAETVSRPVWSPTEERFSFFYERTRTEICSMYAVVGEGPICHPVTTDNQGITWSPDGRSIAYTASSETGTKILLVDPLKGQSTLLLDQENYRIAGISWKP